MALTRTWPPSTVVWQISDEATDVKADTQYDKMTITSVDATAGTITMENKDNAITLSKNKDTALMTGIKHQDRRQRHPQVLHLQGNN